MQKTQIPVIGGHSGITIIPVLSQTQPSCKFSEDEVRTLTERIQNAGTEVVKAKAGAVSFTFLLQMKIQGENFSITDSFSLTDVSNEEFCL